MLEDIVIEENDGCKSEDNPWIFKMAYSLKGTEHQESITHDKVINEQIEKICAMGDGSFWLDSRAW